MEEKKGEWNGRVKNSRSITGLATISHPLSHSCTFDFLFIKRQKAMIEKYYMLILVCIIMLANHISKTGSTFVRPSPPVV